MSQQTQSNVIRLSQPGAGQTATIVIDQGNMRLGLGFEPDPNAVNKDGQDLVFTFDDGGSIVLQGYYDHFADKALPVMVLDNGDELPGEDFLASLREDLLTAAGPGAGAGAAGSGSGEYSDDPGALIDGINRLGSLGTIYWDRETEVTEEYNDAVFPSGSFDFGISTGFGEIVGAYEDAQPNQHLGDQSIHAARIAFNPTPGPATVVSEVRFFDLPEGTQLWLGDPNEGGTLLVPSAAGVYVLNEGNFGGPGVYLIPPANSDTDFTFQAEVDFTAGGTTITVGAPIQVIVDAVADQPVIMDMTVIGDLVYGEPVVIRESSETQEFKEGYAVDEFSRSENAEIAPQSIATSVKVSVAFSDYGENDITDQGEQHYVLVEVPGPGWSCPDAMDVISLKIDGNGKPLADQNAAGDWETKEFFQIHVPNADIAAGGGEVNIDIPLRYNGSDYNAGDINHPLWVGGMAREEGITDSETVLENNVSYMFDDELSHVNLDVDVINSQLTVKVGWASEGNDASKHIEGDYTPEGGGVLNATSNLGAPVTFALSGSEGSPEYITSITLTFNGDRGVMVFRGEEFDGSEVTLSAEALGMTAEEFSRLLTQESADGLHFRPAESGPASYLDTDIDLGYTVNVSNGADASATYTGNTVIIVDAVADRAEVEDVTIEANASHLTVVEKEDTEEGGSGSGRTQDFADGWATDTFTKATEAGGDAEGLSTTPNTITANFTATLAFSDYVDGSEIHTALMQVPAGANGESWALDIAAFNMKYADSGVSLAVDGQGDPVTVTLYVYTDANGKRSVIAEGDAPEGWTEGNGHSTVDYYQINVDNGYLQQHDGVLELDVNFVSSNVYNDAVNVEVDLVAKAEETGPAASGGEYDQGNNVSYTFAGGGEAGEAGGEYSPPSFTVDTIDSTLQVKVGWASEDNDPSQHKSGGYDQPFGSMRDLADGTDASKMDGVDSKSSSATGAPISVTITPNADYSVNETITEATFTFTGGTLYSGFKEVTHGSLLQGFLVSIDGDTVTLTLLAETMTDPGYKPVLSLDHLGLTMQPSVGNSDADITVNYTVTVASPTEVGGTGASATYTGSTTVVVDAVADQPTNVTVDNDFSVAGHETVANSIVEVSGSVKFADNDGSEIHYAVISFDNNFGEKNWTIEAGEKNFGSADMLGSGAINAHWASKIGGNITADSAPVADILGDSAAPSLLVETYKDGNTWAVKVWASDGKGGLQDVTTDFPDAQNWFNPETGTLSYSFDVRVPDLSVDESTTIHAKGVTLEKNPGSGEYDFANNISVASEGDATTIHVDAITTGLYVKFNAVEDNEANQYKDSGESAAGNSWSGASEFGVAINLQLMEVETSGDNKGHLKVDGEGNPIAAVDADFISSLTFNTVPGEEGAIFFKGTEVVKGDTFSVDADGALWLKNTELNTNTNLGNAETLGWPAGFTFRPANDWSGDYELDVTAAISSSTSTATIYGVTPQEGPGLDAHLHVDSVADKTQINTAKPTFDDDGNYITGTGIFDGRAAGGDTQRDAGQLTHEDGWAKQTSEDVASVEVAFGVSGKFTDLDGSETAEIRIELLPGFTLPEGSPFQYLKADGKAAANPAEAKYVSLMLETETEPGVFTTALNADTLPTTIGGITINADGTFSGTVTLDMAEGSGKPSLTVDIITRDPDTGHITNSANDEAHSVVNIQTAAEFFSGTLNVQVGWAYEDGKPNKFGGTAGGPDESFDENAAAGTETYTKSMENMVPVQITYTPGADTNEKLDTFEISYNPEAGTLYLYGLAIGLPDGKASLNAAKVGNAGADGGLFFQPNPGYSDADINLSYKAIFTDTGGVKYTVTGMVDIVVDAVADKATVNVEAPEYKDADGGIHTAAAPGSEKVTLNLSLEFANDGSETQYVFIPSDHPYIKSIGQIDGLTRMSADDINGLKTAMGSLYPEGDFLVLAVNKGSIDFGPDDTNPTGTLDLAIPVTIKSVEELKAIPKDPDNPEAGNQYQDGVIDLGVKVVVIEGAGNNPNGWSEAPLADNEYDFTNNVAITDKGVPVTLGVVGSKLALDVGFAYEDNQPDQNVGDYSQHGGAKIGFTGLHDGESITEVTFTFTVPNASAPGTIMYGGASYTLVNGMVATPDGLTIKMDAGKVTLEIDNFDNSSLYYKPGANNLDTDIRDLGFSATVRDNASGMESTKDPDDNPYSNTGVGGTLGAIVIDAVADLPLEAGGNVAGYDLDHEDFDPDKAFTEADWGSTISVAVKSTFTDIDGSEAHYLVVEARAGWSCENAQGLVEIGGKMYFYVNVDKAEGGPNEYTYTFKIVAPGENALSAGNADYDAIVADGHVSLQSGGLAIEGKIDTAQADEKDVSPHRVDFSATGDTVSYPDLYDATKAAEAGKTRNEVEYDNNIAINTGDVRIDFNVVNGLNVTSKVVYEDHAANKDAVGDLYQADQTDGVITLGIGKTSGDTINSGVITFKCATEPGSFTINGVEYTVNNAPGSIFTGPDKNGFYTLNVTSAINTDGDTITVRYNPPAFDNTDLTDVSYSLNVTSDTSSADKQVTGPIGTDGYANTISQTAGTGTLIVDSVADKPTMAEYAADAVDYGTTTVTKIVNGQEVPEVVDKTAAALGETVKVDVSVKFHDLMPDSATGDRENHYIVIKTAGWNMPNAADGGWSADHLVTMSTKTEMVAAMGETAYSTLCGKLGVSNSAENPGFVLLKADSVIDNAVDAFGKAVAAYKAEGSPAIDAEGWETVINGVPVTLNVDGTGRLTGSVDGDVDVTLTYDAHGQLMATVETTVQVSVPQDTTLGDKGDGTITLETGGVAVDVDSDRSGGTANDVAVDTENTQILVDKANSDFDLSLDSFRVYENGKPLWYMGKGVEGEVAAHEGYTQDGVTYSYDTVGGWKYDETTVVNGKYTEKTFVPLFDGDGDVIAANLPYCGAQLTMKGILDGETATVKLVFTLEGDSKGELTDPYDLGAFYDAQGNEIAIKVDVDSANGTVTVTFNAEGLADGGNQSIYFVPGTNYNANDLSIDWTARIQDNASGHITTAEPDKNAEDYRPMEITVDAVAQPGSVDGLNLKGGVLYVQNSQDFDLEIQVTFLDNDGSEARYVLVQMVDNAGIDPEFIKLLENTLDYDLDASSSHYHHFGADKTNPEGVYYKIPVDQMLTVDEAGTVKVIDAFKEYLDIAEDGSFIVKVPMVMDSSLGNTDSVQVKTGTMTVDHDNSQFNEYLENGVIVTDKMNETKINDVSVVIEEAIVIEIAHATISASMPDAKTYEDDNRDAHLASDTGAKDGGVILSPSITLGSGEVFQADVTVDEQVTVTWPKANGHIVIDGTRYDSGEIKMSLAQLNELSGDGKITFVPTGTDDADVNITYTVAPFIDGNSGHEHPGATFTQKVIVDAVAQKPEFNEKVAPAENVENFFTVHVTFTDIDGSTSHAVLVDYKAGWTLEYTNASGDPVEANVVTAPDGNRYYEIPVTIPENTSGTSYAANVSGWLKQPGHHIGGQEVVLSGGATVIIPDNDGPFGYAAVSMDHPNPENAITELDWTNNTSFIKADDAIGIKGDWTGTGGDGGKLIYTFENDTPLAHLGNDQTMGGATLVEGSSLNDGDVVTISINGPGSITINGVVVTGTPNATGGHDYTITVTAYNKGDINFVPADNYKDNDVRGTVSVNGDEFSFTAIVDAVAQQAQPVENSEGVLHDWLTPVTEGDYAACKPGGTIVINGKATFPDTDGSETHYVLIERQPGWDIDGDYETMSLEGTTYFKIVLGDDVDYNAETGDFAVKLIPPAGGEKDADGLVSHELGYKIVAEEKVSDEEVMGENNMAIVNGSLTIKVSEVNTTVRLADTHDEILENGTFETTMTLNVGEWDKVETISFKVEGGAGGTLTVGGKSYLVGEDGIVTLTPTDHADLFQNNQTASPINDVTTKVTFTPDNYANNDVTIKVSVGATDTKSGDAGGGKVDADIDIDAVAWAPDITGGVAYATDDGNAEPNKAARVGEPVKIAIGGSFQDVGSDSKESHFLLVEHKNGWDYPDALSEVTYDSSRTEFLMIPVDKYIDTYQEKSAAGELTDGVYTITDNGITYTVTAGVGGKITVSAELDVTLPNLHLPKDGSWDLKVGGVSIDTPFGDYNTISNDVAFNTGKTIEIKVGVVEATSATLTMAPVGEDVAAQMEFVLTGGSNDSIKDVVITGLPEGGQIGTMVDGVFTPIATELPITLNGATAQAGGYYYQPPAHKHGDFSVEYQVTVQDNASGATKTFPANGTSQEASVDVTAVADTPTIVSVGAVDYDPKTPGILDTDPKAAAPGKQVSFDVNVTFPDHDGSENHYILVEYKTGWSCVNGTKVDTPDGAYWRIPVADNALNAAGTGAITVKLTPPSTVSADASHTFKVGGFSEEKSGYANGTDRYAYVDAEDMGSVTVQVNAADSTWAKNVTAEAVSSGVEDSTGAAFKISFKDLVDDSEAGTIGTHDTVTQISIKGGLPEGAYITDGTSKFYVGDKLDAGKLAEGGYYFVAGKNQSGQFEPQFDVTFKDEASGHVNTVNGSVKVTITGVTDAPESQSHTGPTVVDQVGHTASASTTLKAEFGDLTGTETHFFLMQLPTGASLPANSGWKAVTADEYPGLLTASGLEGTVYIYVVDSKTANPTAQLNLTGLPANYEGNLTYMAGSYENTGVDAGARNYGFITDSDNKPLVGQAAIKTNEVINEAPTLTLRTEDAHDPVDALRNPNGQTDGKITMSDNDSSDTVVVTTVTFNGVDYPNDDSPVTTEGDNTYISVKADHGTFKINVADGTYTYTLDENADPSHGAQESFKIVGSDQYLPGAETDEITVTVTLNNTNTGPVITAEVGKNSGGGNEPDYTPLTGKFSGTDDDGDMIVVTSASGESMADNPDATVKVDGNYGYLEIARDGSYTYVQTNRYAEGEEVFTIGFKDVLYTTVVGDDAESEYGVNDEVMSSLTIAVKPVNQAPVAQSTELVYQSGLGSAQDGQLLFNSGGEIGQAVAVAFVQLGDNPPEAVPTNAPLNIDGQYGTLQIYANGSYSYAPKVDADSVDGYETFSYQVKDAGGLTDTAEIHIRLGQPDELVDIPVKIVGSGGDDILSVPLATPESEASYVIYGGGGDDTIYGGASDTVIFGGDGDDIIFAGTGTNEITGGAGADIFGWTQADFEVGGMNTILDFDMATDKLFFQDLFSGDEEDIKGQLETMLGDTITVDFGEVADGKTDQISITVNSGEITTTVDIHLNESITVPTESSDAQAALLAQMITTVTG